MSLSLEQIQKMIAEGRIHEAFAMVLGETHLATKTADGLLHIVTGFTRHRGYTNLLTIACNKEIHYGGLPFAIKISDQKRMCAKCRKWGKLFLQCELDEAKAKQQQNK